MGEAARGPVVLHTKHLPSRGACVAGTPPSMRRADSGGFGADPGDLGKNQVCLSCTWGGGSRR